LLSEVAHLRMRNSTDFQTGGLKLAHTNGMKAAIRVLEHATRLVTRAALNSTSANNHTGRLASELEGYLTRLKRIAKQGKTEEFYRVLRNAQMKLIKLVGKLIR
jgi:hypothetical protein